MSSRAGLRVLQERAAACGFVASILWSHSCLSGLGVPQRKSLPQVGGRTWGLGLLCACTAEPTHTSAWWGGAALSAQWGLVPCAPQLLQKHPDRCQHLGVCLTDTRPGAPGEKDKHSPLSLPAVFCTSTTAPFTSPFSLAKFGVVPRPILSAQLHPCPH